MNHIFVRSNFAEREGFRLVSMDDAWVRQFRESAPSVTPPASASSSKRPRPADADAEVDVVLVMKGEDQLCLHDATSTRSVRRVEYSNVMMLAKRRLNATGRAALASAASEDAAPATPPPLQRVRECSDDVVIASLGRMFDSHAAHPQLNILSVLAESHLSIDELEAEEAEEADGGPAPIGSTFGELARRFHSSPQELATLLESIGAVVHRGRVRLLHPSLVSEALRATLTYFDGATPAELTWAAVRRHLSPSVYPAVVLRSLEAVYGAPAKGTEEVAVAGLAGLLHLPRVLVGLAAGVFDVEDIGVSHRSLGTGAVARGLPLETFLEKWWDALPSSLFGVAEVPLRTAANAAERFVEKLRGYAILEPRAGGVGSGSGGSGGRSQGTLWWLPKDALTNDFAARLAVLFELRPQKWDQLDLKAYMEGLLAPDQSFQHIIVRYVREYRIPGQVVQYAPLT